MISTLAGTGAAGFSGDGGPADAPQLRQPHSIAVDRHGTPADLRHRQPPHPRASISAPESSRPIGGTGERQPTAGRRAAARDAAQRPAHDGPRRRRRPLPGASRGQRDLPHRRRRPARSTTSPAPASRATPATAVRRASATLGGPKGLALARRHASTSPTPRTTSIRRIDLETGVINTVLGTGAARRRPGAGSAAVPAVAPARRVRGRRGTLYVGDSEAHRIRVLTRGA